MSNVRVVRCVECVVWCDVCYVGGVCGGVCHVLDVMPTV